MHILSRLAPFLRACLLAILCCSAFGAEPEIAVTLQKRGDAFIVDASLDLPVALRTAWDVLTDFEHMAGILSNLSSSKVIRRDGGNLGVVQEGAVRYGIFSYSFASEREIRLEPMKRIFSRQLTGTARRYESEMLLSSSERGTQLRYQVTIVPDSGLARAFGASFVEHEVEEQLSALAAEMIRRSPPDRPLAHRRRRYPERFVRGAGSVAGAWRLPAASHLSYTRLAPWEARPA